MSYTLSDLMGQKCEHEQALRCIHKDIGRALAELRAVAHMTLTEAASSVALPGYWGPRIVANLEAGEIWNERVSRLLADFYCFALAEPAPESAA